MVTSYYVDASIIAGLVLGDIDVDPIVASVGDGSILTYSEFGFGEVVAATSARVRATKDSDENAAAQVEALRHYMTGWHRTAWLTDDLGRAITFSARASLGLELADALHCAIAERIRLPLLTTDRQQFKAALKIGIKAYLPLISR